MDRLDENVLKQFFPEVNASKTGRYQKNDIIKVLEFMKEHPNVQVRSIQEFSKISLGTLVSWRKKYGKYMGIKTKNYSGSSSYDLLDHGAQKPYVGVDNTSENLMAKISLSLINELQKTYKAGSKAEISIDNIVFRVDNENLYVVAKN